MTSTPDSDSESGAIFKTSRFINRAPDDVYHAFATPERLARWWGPEGFRNTFETFELRVGGQWKFMMHGPDGTDYPNESVFVELSPPHRVIFEHICAPVFKMTITFTSEGSGTRVGWRQEFEDAGFAAQVRHIIVPANEQNLDRLEAELELQPASGSSALLS